MIIVRLKGILDNDVESLNLSLGKESIKLTIISFHNYELPKSK